MKYDPNAYRCLVRQVAADRLIKETRTVEDIFFFSSASRL